MVRQARQARAPETGTADQILDVAERIMQVVGYNGFSYADVAGELGITKAALHYHFASKADLGAAVIARYAARFSEALATVGGSDGDPFEKLRAYAELYLEVLRGRRMCLCGMLAAEYETLPVPMRDAVVGFFDDNEAWLEHLLEQGRAGGTVTYFGPARDVARTIVSGLEGAMLLARSGHDVARFQVTAAQLLAGLVHSKQAVASPRQRR